jgi:structural maintenance of chromosome 2
MDSVDTNGDIVPGGTCIEARISVLTSCALSIFMDLVIIPIPSLMVWGLQMSPRTKFFVVIIMSLGWLATGVSVGRFIVYYYRFAPTMKDRTWNIGIAISIAEPAVHIMTACAPATKCLFRYLFPQYNTHQSPGYNGNQYTYGHSGRSRSRGSRTLGTFRLGLDDEELEVDPETGRVVMKNEVDLKTVAPKEVVDEPVSQRTMSCSKTACTVETSEPVEVQPNHMLGQAI